MFAADLKGLFNSNDCVSAGQTLLKLVILLQADTSPLISTEDATFEWQNIINFLSVFFFFFTWTHVI